jgi:hypothetical protein
VGSALAPTGGCTKRLHEALRGHSGEDVNVEDLFESYKQSGLPADTMGRTLETDEDFFRAALAAGQVLAERIGGES